MEDMMARKNKNHNLEQRQGVWFLRRRINGKLKYKKLSASVLTARVMRDEILAEGVEDLTDSLFNDFLYFGDIVVKWKARQMRLLEKDQLKTSTWEDWKSAMNRYVLPYFANKPIKEITPGNIDSFTDTLSCSAKRINNILVPVRSVFKFAKRQGYIENNIMDDVGYLKPKKKPQINPLNIDEVNAVIAATEPHYKPFMIIAFFSGMRFGEMAALKWTDIDFFRKLILVRSTLVRGEFGRTKTLESERDVNMVGPVFETFKSMKRKGKFVFLDRTGALMTPDHFRNVVWKPALKRAEVVYRPPMQTRHTFATIAISNGEDIGWV
ncbi:MAG: hypothetical protein CSA32_01820, partial [Desulfobulbus propionicus]